MMSKKKREKEEKKREKGSRLKITPCKRGIDNDEPQHNKNATQTIACLTLCPCPALHGIVFIKIPNF